MSTTHGETNGQSTFQSTLPEIRDRDWLQACQVSHPPVPRRIGSPKIGSRSLWYREWQVIAGVAEGLKNKDIAQYLGTTEHVVKNYLRVIYEKLGFDNRT